MTKIEKLKELEAKATEYPGYSVDADGNVWSHIPWRGTACRRLATHPNAHGYPAVKVKTAGGVKKALVHKMVCAAFHGPRPSPSHQVRHLNGVRTDCRKDNLAWGTPSENATDRKAHGTERAAENGRKSREKVSGEAAHLARLSAADVQDIRARAAAGEGYARIARSFPQVNRTTIRRVAIRETWANVD